MRYFTSIFNIFSNCAIRLLNAAEVVTAECFKQAMANYIYPEPKLEADLKHNRDIDEKASKFIGHLRNILLTNNKFFDFIHSYFLALASDKSHEVTNHLLIICGKVEEVLKACDEFSLVHLKTTKFKELTSATHQLQTDLGNTYFHSILWGMSKIAHNLIKSVPEEKSENLDKLMRSKLVSGGIENKFISEFSEKGQKEISILKDFLNDNKSKETTRSDQYLMSIISSSSDQDVDAFIEFMKWHYSIQKPEEKSPTADEITLVRCVFASMIKCNDLTSEAIQLIVKLSELRNASRLNPDNYEAHYKELQHLPEFAKITRRWSNSNKIRVWFAKKIDAETALVKKKLEEKLDQDHKKSAAKEEENKESLAKEIIEEKKETVGSPTKTQEIHLVADKLKVEKEMQIVKSKLLKSQIQKAEILIKMVTPKNWDQRDSEVKKVMTFTRSSTSKLEKNSPKKMQIAKRKQTSTYVGMGKKEVFDNCQSSVLAYFKLEISAKEFLTALERVYVKGLKRVAGFKIMATVLGSYQDQSCMAN